MSLENHYRILNIKYFAAVSMAYILKKFNLIIF